MHSRRFKLHQHLQAAEHLLRWFAVVAVWTILAAIISLSPAHAGDRLPGDGLPGDGLLLRPGNWGQDVGSFLLPGTLAVAPHHWPRDGWVRITHKPGHLDVAAVPAPASGLPDFLNDIAVQVSAPGGTHDTVANEAEAEDTLYLRVPGVRLATGRLPTVAFARGTLRPRLDHPYALQLGRTAFTLTVHNGQRNSAGVAYGEGARYVVAMGGQTYTWQLGQYGWDSTVLAVADLDADGLPDFIVSVGGSNSGDEFLLLSSQARPGRNEPAATLSWQGC